MTQKSIQEMIQITIDFYSGTTKARDSGRAYL